jgi:hypothetical protein
VKLQLNLCVCLAWRCLFTTDLVCQMCQRYIFLFSAFVTLTVQEEETMIFSKYARSFSEWFHVLT